ncbi:hypothetical protein [Clostridium lacusfryxellense]|uniref:hypothetical protein n=1 Tax=Clostridium lacusfryxellense TaxID=205328 RepID=UPI001C0B9540|nr:hypothetical protein [Clostridium lacusfryxellense]MBU3110169.1 hypothetical protein [Clostridium lacusfryxellense]
MKVKELISIFSRAEKVLKLYENKTVDEMIDDIYLRLCTTNIEDKYLETSNNNNNNNNKKKTVSNIIMDQNIYKKIIDEIKDKEKREIIDHIQELKKDELIHLAKSLDLKLNKSSKKGIMIESIASYFSSINLNQKVSERNEEELQKFINSNK